MSSLLARVGAEPTPASALEVTDPTRTKACAGVSVEELRRRRRTRALMEFSALIDKLDDVLANARHVPLSSDVRVDRQETCAIVAQLRRAIPDELTDARWISEHRDEMLAEAKSEIAQILEQAHEERARLLGREALAKAAEERVRHLHETAADQERELRRSAEQHALQIIEGLEAYLAQLAGAVERGRARLAERNPDQLIQREPDRLVARSGNDAAGRHAALA